MKAQIISDLHTEFIRYPTPFLSTLPWEPDLDFLILAGDIVVPGHQDNILEVFKYLSEKARHLVYVLGNHEYYDSPNAVAVEETFKGIVAKIPNFTWLHNQAVKLSGVTFIGGTMWFREDPHWIFYKEHVGDFAHIPGFASWVFNANRDFEKFYCQQEVSNAVVVTHHAPTFNSVPPRYKESELNRFFINDMSRFLEQGPPLWIHGHLHNVCDYKCYNTRVICNAVGYPWEAVEHNKVVIELPL